MTDMTTDLLKRLEAGETGREIDAHIGWHLDGHHTKFCPTPEILLNGMTDFGLVVPHYTTSLDAAVALVERVLPGCDWTARTRRKHPYKGVYPSEATIWGTDTSQSLGATNGFAPTPAAALIVALLKANGGGG